MKSPSMPVAALLAASLFSTTAQAQERVTPEVAASQLTAALSVISGGTLATPEHPLRVTPDGTAFNVRVPLPNLIEPPDAALTARAQPLGGGVWEIAAAALPAAGTLTAMQAGPRPAPRIAYSIGGQTITGKIDPSLAKPSPFRIELRDLVVMADDGKDLSKQTIARNLIEGVLTGEPGNRMTLRAQTTMGDWRIGVRDDNGVMRDITIRSAASSAELEGLDRTQSEKLRTLMQNFVGSAQAATASGNKQGDLTTQQRAQLAAMVSALKDVLNRLNIEETVEGVHFQGPNDTEGDIGRFRIAMSGESRDDKLNANIDLALHDLKVSNIPPQFAAYLPSVLQIRPALAGIHTSAVIRFLQHAADGASPDSLQAEALALLVQPGARIGIESLSYSAGPLHLEGSGRMLPPSGGIPGVEAHIKARGIDATLAMAQRDPNLQQAMPVIFLIKGMAKAQGDALVWDVAFNDGELTVNGVPFGQPAQQQAPAKQAPQKKRQ